MKKIGVAGLQREQIKKTIEATAPGSLKRAKLFDTVLDFF